MKNSVRASIALGAALVLAACGDDEAMDADDAGGEFEPVTVGTLPVLPTAVIHLGLEQGFFEDEGIDLDIQTGQGGAALIPAVISQEYDFATGDVVALLTARDRDLDVRALTSFTYDTDDGVHAVLVQPDSGISGIADLEGTTIAINVLQSMGQLLLTEALQVNGVDPTTVEFVEIGFPSMEAALEQGQVDAVWTPEPFMTILEGNGAVPLMYPGVEAVTGHPTMVFFTSGALLAERPETAEAMTRAMTASMDYATENPDELRQTAVEILEVDPAIAETVVLEEFGGDLRVEQIERMGELMVEQGFVDDEADVAGLLESN